MKSATEPQKRTGIKQRLKSLAFSLVLFLAFLVVLELVLRTTHLFGARPSWVQPDPVLGWRPTPGAHYWQRKENPKPISGRMNSFGWRDKEWSVTKPEGTYRIAVLGDSIVEGLQVESDRTFLALAERRMNDAGNPKVELMNFGRGSCCATEELLILKSDVEKFSPDMVALFFMPHNDIQDVSRETAHPKARPYYTIPDDGKLVLDTSFAESREYKIKRFINWPKQHSALLSLVTDRFNAVRQHQATLETKTPKRGYMSLCTDDPEPKAKENYELAKTLIKAIAERCQERGAKFLLVTVDLPAYMPQVEKEFQSVVPSYDGNFFEDDLGEFAESIGAECLGLQRLLRKAYEAQGTEFHWETWGHWNYKGHEIVADAFAEKLESMIKSSEEGE